MPLLTRPCGAIIHYMVRGHGTIDVLLLAPGGMNSCIDKWSGQPYNPWEALTRNDKFRVIAMDQRNATQQTASPLGTGWETYRDDQLAVLDEVKSTRCCLVGSCIGPSFAFSLLQHSPQRFPVAVLLQPIGLALHTTEPGESWSGINGGMRQSFAKWSDDLIAQGRFSRDQLQVLHEQMYGPDREFVFSATRDQVSALNGFPMLVFMGKDRCEQEGLVHCRTGDAFLLCWITFCHFVS